MGRNWFWTRVSWNNISRIAPALFPFRISKSQGSKARRRLADSNPYGPGSHDLCYTVFPARVSRRKKPFALVKKGMKEFLKPITVQRRVKSSLRRQAPVR